MYWRRDRVCVVNPMVLIVPPVAVALKPATKLRLAVPSVLVVVTEPLRTLRPLNDAPLTASVNC